MPVDIGLNSYLSCKLRQILAVYGSKGFFKAILSPGSYFGRFCGVENAPEQYPAATNGRNWRYDHGDYFIFCKVF